MTYEILQGNALDVLKTLESESVQCAITSPPYYGFAFTGQMVKSERIHSHGRLIRVWRVK